MTNRLLSHADRRAGAGLLKLALAASMLLLGGVAQAKAPAWIRDLANAPLPAHDDKTDAVLLLSETTLTVLPKGELRQRTRVVFRILRAGGESRGLVRADYGMQSRVTDMRGWAIPADGREFEVRMRDSVESAVLGVDGSNLVSDVRTRVMLIPGTHPGALVGYEIEMELSPLQLLDVWRFQWVDPVREARYEVQLPDGWSMSPAFVNHPAVPPVQSGPGRWSWVLRDVPAVKFESNMPSLERVAGGMSLALIPPQGSLRKLASWREIGHWYGELARDRLQATPAIRAKVAELVKGESDPLGRVRAIARFVQNEIRYVAIEIGIGGYQPHAAGETFANRYGDCKDKVTLMAVMLREAGIESHFLIVNTNREALVEDSPPTLWFDHVVIAVKLPAQAGASDLHTIIDHPALGRLVVFDPTDEVTPVGRLAGALQGGYGLLVTPEGGDFLRLPSVPMAESGLRRKAVLKLDAAGVLSGEVFETYLGDLASAQRAAARGIDSDKEVIRPLERNLASSLANFRIEKADLRNRTALEEPLVWQFRVQVKDYARSNDDLVLVRPRTFGIKASSFLETGEERVHDIVLDEARMDTDEVSIALPAGLVVESLPEPQNLDLGFMAYRSSTEVRDGVLTYRRTMEYRDLRIPAAKAESFKQLLRAISRDERAVALLRKKAG